MLLRTATFAALAALTTLVACAGPDVGDPVDPTALYGRAFRVTRLEANDVPADAGVLLRVDEGKLSGNSGVNAFHGDATFTTAGGFTAGPFAMTRRAGPPEAMQRESLLLVTIEHADGWRMEEGTLRLLAGEAIVLTATATE